MPKCANCGGTGTRAEVIEPDGMYQKLIAICCADCGVTHAVAERYSPFEKIDALEKKIRLLQQAVDSMSFGLHHSAWNNGDARSVGRVD